MDTIESTFCYVFTDGLELRKEGLRLQFDVNASHMKKASSKTPK